MLCREATSDQARPNRLNHKILDIGNRDIIGIAISFLSDTHFRNIYYLINQYPYQYLVFIVRFLQDSGYAPGAIIISTSPSASLKPDESRGVSFNIWILPSRHLLLWLGSYIMRLNQYEKKKVMDKLTWSSGNTERMIPVWQIFQSEWKTRFPRRFRTQ